MRLKLRMNDMGLYQTEDKRWGYRQIGPRFWQVQGRDDPTDPLGWEIVGFRDTEAEAVALLHQSLPCVED